MDPNAAPPKPGTIILVDKPLTWTSFDVVKKVRYHLKLKKVGHAGTLDPLASGLLILCTDKMTKEIEKIQSLEKEYEGVFTIGATTPSYDLETEAENRKPYDHITAREIYEAATGFVGTILQKPPVFSAIKIDGKRAYKSARAGDTVEIKPREVTIKQFDITRITLPEVAFRVVCSKGTYIRSLANDFGLSLGTGAYLSQLRRTRIGHFEVAKAQTIQELTEK